MAEKKTVKQDKSEAIRKQKEEQRFKERGEEISKQGCVIEYADGRVFRLDDTD